MEINKDRLPGSRRLKVLEEQAKTRQEAQQAKIYTADMQQAIQAAAQAVGVTGKSAPTDESILAPFDRILVYLDIQHSMWIARGRYAGGRSAHISCAGQSKEQAVINLMQTAWNPVEPDDLGRLMALVTDQSIDTGQNLP